nr:MAG TPA: hypothetical protein [Bacteriophage sp.]
MPKQLPTYDPLLALSRPLSAGACLLCSRSRYYYITL